MTVFNALEREGEAEQLQELAIAILLSKPAVSSYIMTTFIGIGVRLRKIIAINANALSPGSGHG